MTIMSSSYTEKLEIENGWWKNNEDGSFCKDLDNKAVRTKDAVEVHAGDLVKIGCDNGKYIHYLTIRKCCSDKNSIVRNDLDGTVEDEDVRVAFDGLVTVVFCLSSDPAIDIPAEEFTGSVKVVRDSASHDMILFNPEGIKKALSSQRSFSAEYRSNNPDNNLATIVHVTDVHGDEATFRNAYNVSKILNADAFIATGDMVYYYSTDSVDYIERTVSDGKVDFLMCMGNHDGFLFTPEEQYKKFIEPFAEKYGYNLDGNVVCPTYYYKDYDKKKLRVIVANQFEYDGKDSMKDTRMNLTQEQVDFLSKTLITTPEGYGVIIAMHAPERVPVKDDGYPAFFQDKVLLPEDNNVTVLSDMVDAFISRKSIVKTYSNLEGANPPGFTLSADFSKANTGTEFIAFLNGHYHADAVSYVPLTVNRQLCLNLTTANSWYGMAKSGISGSDNPYLTEFTDLARIGGTPTQDAINVYSIDRENRVWRITRIGSDMPYTMDKPRQYMVMPYAD